MAQNITITLTDTEYKAMEVIAYSPQEWVENVTKVRAQKAINSICLLYTSPSPRDRQKSRMPSSA